MAIDPAQYATGKLAGKTLAFIGQIGFDGSIMEELRRKTIAEGGTIVDPEQTVADLLVVGVGVRNKPPKDLAKLQKKFPQLKTGDAGEFYKLIAPTTEQVLAKIHSGADDDYWHETQLRLSYAETVLELKGVDFRGGKIAGAFHSFRFLDCDFRGCEIEAQFPGYDNRAIRCNFDGAKFTGGYFGGGTGCSLKNVTMEEVRWNPARFENCDFTGSKLHLEHGIYTHTTLCVFASCEMPAVELQESKFVAADFTGANLAGADLSKSDFSRANFSGANLEGANLTLCSLESANLQNANLKNALLTNANLAGATIDGAEFHGAHVTGANFQGVDQSTAKNLLKPLQATSGPNLLRLAATANGAKMLQTSIELDLGPRDYVLLDVVQKNTSFGLELNSNYKQFTRGILGEYKYINSTTFDGDMLALVDRWARGQPRFDSVKTDVKPVSLRTPDLQNLAVAAWHEALGLTPPTADQLQETAKQQAADQASLRDVLLAELMGGAESVRKWNAREERERLQIGKLRKHNFSRAELPVAYFLHLDLQGCIFDGAELRNALFYDAQLKGASFAGANLREATFTGAKCSGANFQGAVLHEASLTSANFQKCNFRDADLKQADFDYSDLRGADFTGAVLQDNRWRDSQYDEHTIFPAGFTPPEEMEWKGKGRRPSAAPSPVAAPTGSLDFAAFIAKLHVNIDKPRLEKATSMLKAEAFQLFAEVQDDSLGGIVKSQSDPDLVYSCRLTSSGTFGCCTQNLRPCGGLRGALCKHLLVLIIGLAKAGQLDSATVDHWIELSKDTKPKIDVDAMSATFLKYKGAEAGEIDWRPTETIPEDFYSM